MNDRRPSIGSVQRQGTADRPAPGDVRLRGFPDRASLEEAQAWVDACPAPAGREAVPLEAAAGRVLAAPLTAPADLPAAARAGVDGYAVRASDTLGAGPYDPRVLALGGPAGGAPGGPAALVSAGDPLPADADAVVGFDAAEAAGAAVELIAPATAGGGVEPARWQATAGAALFPAGRPLGPAELALLASLGVARVEVVAVPRIRLVIPGPRGAGAPDACGPLLRALIARDGGVVEAVPADAALREALGSALRHPAPALVLVAGRTGTGPDDDAPPALAALGALAIHGVAVRPGGSAGLGLLGGVPIALLPGDPLACLVAYELLAGRLVRRLAGRPARLPHRTIEAVLARKLVSAVGVTEVHQVRLSDDGAEPLGALDFGGLAGAARADGFVVVPEALEGYPAGARITVHLH